MSEWRHDTTPAPAIGVYRMTQLERLNESTDQMTPIQHSVYWINQEQDLSHYKGNGSPLTIEIKEIDPQIDTT